MALVGVGWLLQSVLAVCAAAIQAVQSTRPWIHKHSRTRHYLSILRCRQWHLNHVNAKERSIGVLVRGLTGAPGQLFALTDKRGPRDVDIDVVLIIRINYQGMRVRAAAGLHRCHLLRIPDVGDIENPYPAEAIFLRCRKTGLVLLSRSGRWLRRKTLWTAIQSAIRLLHRHKEQVLVN